MIGATPPFPAAGYVPPGIVTGDADPLTIGGGSAPEFQFPPGTQVSISQSKVINTTKVNGKKGTIKEISGMDDWEVSISFKLISPLYSFEVIPADAKGGGSELSIISKLKKLKSMWIVDESIPLTHEKLNAMGIDHVVLKRFNIPDNETNWTQPVTLEGLSDTAIDVDRQQLDAKAERTGAALA